MYLTRFWYSWTLFCLESQKMCCRRIFMDYTYSVTRLIYFVAIYIYIYIYIYISVNRCGGMVLLPFTQNYRFRMRREGMERFPRLRFQKKPRISDPGMHHGTCDTHVPWCMSGSLIRGGGENVSGIPGACATRNFGYLVRGPFSNHPHEERSFSYKIIQHWPKSKVLDKCAEKKFRDVFLIYANGADCSYHLIF